MSFGHRTEILHVDDDPGFTDVTKTFLERERSHFAVITLNDPRAVLSYLEDNAVDCIVSDYEMPEMTGLELLERVRATSPDLPFILFTGKGTEEVASRAISAGVSDYLQKGGGSDQFTVLANRIGNAIDQTEYERQFETLVSNVPGMIYRMENAAGWPVDFVGGEVEALTGYTADQLESGEVVWGDDIVHPGDREQVWQEVQETLSTDDAFELVYRIETRTGDRRWVWERGRQVDVSADGAAILEGFISDITERKEREQELARQRTVFGTLIENLPDGVLVEDESREILAANSALATMFGDELSPEDLVGRDCAVAAAELRDQFVDPSAFVESIETRLADRETVRGEEFVLDDGRILERDYIPYELPDGEANLWIYADVTEDHEQQRLLSGLFEESLEGIAVLSLITDDDGVPVDYVFRRVNPRFEELTGLDSEEITGCRASVVFGDGADIPMLEPAGSVALGGRPTRFEHRSAAYDGEYEISAFSPRYGQCICFFSDISARKRRERELERERDQLDQFASVVSHDLRNPLQVAQTRLDLVREETESPHLDSIETALDRCGTIIEDVLLLAREGREIGETGRVPLRRTAEEAWETTTATNEAAALEFVGTAGNDPTVIADPERFRQLLENLFRNAVDHGLAETTRGESASPGSDDGGTAPQPADLTVRVVRTESGFAVEDDGPGIEPDARDDVFTAGYSTSREGNGFGLAIVKQIADAHGWDVTVGESSQGGARFAFSGVEFAP